MSEEQYTYYYGRIDYPAVIARQIDRIAYIRTNLSYPVNRIDFFRLQSAIKTLYMLSPKKVREAVGKPPNSSLSELDEYFMQLRDELEKCGLIGGKIIERGSPDVNIHEENSISDEEI